MCEVHPNQASLFYGCLGWNNEEIYDGLDYYHAVGQFLVEHTEEEVYDGDGVEAPRVPLLNIVTTNFSEPGLEAA